MMRLIAILLTGVVVSGYYFSFAFTFLPVSINTKVMLAVTGVFLLCYKRCQTRDTHIPTYLIGSIVLAAIFSCMCLIAADLNQTHDYSYATYISSFFTWLAGAYTVCTVIRIVHGHANLKLLVNYLASVCVIQCILAILINHIPSLEQLVDMYINQGQSFFREVNRLYGIGAALDTAGVRFTIVLVLITHLLCKDLSVLRTKWESALYFTAFFIIAIIGNMVARTTTIGIILSILYLIFSTGIFRFMIQESYIKMYKTLALLLIAVIIIVIYLYYNDNFFYHQFRFAFEGFFYWMEKGEFRTSSTDKLNAVMWIWPENMKTWMIGSGLFGLFIYGTDIGYCRFILYCGLIGFGTFALFFVYNAWVLYSKSSSYRLLSLAFLSLTFIIWIKVSTDIFIIYALLYCLDDTTESNFLIDSEKFIK